MSRTDLQHNHRFPPALKAILEDAAKANKRSLTAEINARLEQSFLGNDSDPESSGSVPTLPVLLTVDAKLTALCKHLGLKT